MRAMVDGDSRSFSLSAGGLHGTHTVPGGSATPSVATLPSEMHGSMHTLVTYGESDEEVALPDDDIAFCLRSMFASPG